MGLLSTIAGWFSKKGNNGPSPATVEANGLPVFQPIFSADVTKELNATFMNCVNSNARHFSKIVPLVLFKGEKNPNQSRMQRILAYQPNPRQNAATFWRTVGKSYFMHNLAIIWPEWDFRKPNEPLRALWPIDIESTFFSMVINKNDGRIAVKFDVQGEVKYEWLDDLIVLEREVDISGNFAGTSPYIDQTLRVLSTQYDGVMNTILQANYVQYICSISNNVADEVLAKRQESMDKLWFGQKSRVIMVNGGDTLQRIEPRGTMPGADAIKEFKADLYQYQSTNENIVSGKFNEDQWQAYYEACLEPLIYELGLELTNKLFTEAEFYKGNSIEVQTNPLQTASLATRTKIVSALKGILPIVVPNDLLKLLYLPPIEGGDKPMQTLNYVDASKANDYQDVDDEPEEKPKEDE